MRPSITIVIPTYNRADTLLEKALKSVFSQKEKDFEVIVVDDGSKDRTKEALKPLVDSQKIIYIHQENKGVSAARNLGVKHAKGDYIVFLDSDDELLPEYLTVVKDNFSKTDAEVLIPGFLLIDELGKTSKAPINKPAWMFGIGGGGAFRKTVFLDKGIWYDEKLRNFEDSDIGFRLIKKCKIIFLKKYFYIYHFNKLAVYKSDFQSLSSNPKHLLRDFKVFKEKNEVFYKEQGSKALRHLYFWEGTIYANYDIKEARRLFLEAFLISPSVKSFFYLLMSALGSRLVYKALNQSFIFSVRQYKILRDSI